MSSRTTSLYKNHRFPSETIAHAVWLYHRFSLSFRKVEELLAERGVTVSHEAVRLRCLKFGQIGSYFDAAVARQLKSLAVEEDTTVQRLLAEALDLLFESRNKPPIARQV